MPRAACSSSVRPISAGETTPFIDGTHSCPTFVAVGALDPVMPVACGEELAAKIPNAELVMFSRSGHNPAMEESALFRAAVLRFLAENSPA